MREAAGPGPRRSRAGSFWSGRRTGSGSAPLPVGTSSGTIAAGRYGQRHSRCTPSAAVRRGSLLRACHGWWAVTGAGTLRDQLRNDLTVNVGEAVVATLGAEREPLVVHSEQAQHGRV